MDVISERLALTNTSQGTPAVLTIHHGVALYVITLAGDRADDAQAVVIGSGYTRKAALGDAQACLQHALDCIDVAIVKGDA